MSADAPGGDERLSGGTPPPPAGGHPRPPLSTEIPEHVREELRAALHLSQREVEIALLMVDGHPQKRIALRLGSRARTVETHVRRIYAKLGVGNQRELIARLFAAYYHPESRPDHASRDG